MPRPTSIKFIINPTIFALLFAAAAGAAAQEAPSSGAQKGKSSAGDPLREAQDSAKRAMSSNNLKQISLGLLNFVSARKRFPPAAIRDKDGKPLLSWRVAILPYIEQNDLYKEEFHLDEPWDSDHNKALLAKMPAVFRSPFDDPKSTNASYFMPTSTGMLAEGDQGKRVRDITDGMSRTIMLIEAKRDIPWTKPEDIEIDTDPAKPLPKIGFPQAGDLFAVAFADGSIHRVADTIDPKLLRAMLTVAGGETIPIDVMSQTVLGREEPKPGSGEPPQR